MVTLSFNREKSFLLSAFESECEVFFSYFNDYSCFTDKHESTNVTFAYYSLY